jgi:hypothetical protein
MLSASDMPPVNKRPCPQNALPSTSQEQGVPYDSQNVCPQIVGDIVRYCLQDANIPRPKIAICLGEKKRCWCLFSLKELEASYCGLPSR